MQIMTYQPVMMQQMVQPVQQFVQPVQQVQQVAVRPQVATLANTDDCNLPQVCRDLADLKERVAALSEKLESISGSGDLERRIQQNEEAVEKLTTASNLQTEILEQLKVKLLDGK